MHIRKYGIELKALTKKDLPLVLQWRNDPEVRKFMLYQHEITMDEHKAWFTSLGLFSHYLMITYQGRKIGVFNLRDVDMDDRSAEAGIFIGEEEFRNSIVPMLCILGMMDVCFDVLGMKILTARVRKDNIDALRMNEELGYSLSDMYDDAYHMRVEAAQYKRKRERFAHILKRFDQEPEKFSFSAEETAFFRPVK